SLLCDRPRLKERAEALLDHLFVDFFSSTEGMQHTNQVDGQLADQLWALRAATAAFSHGLGEHWRGQALQLAELLERQYADPELGGYFDHAGRDRLGRLADPVKPLAENANVAIALWQLDVLSANPAAPLIDRARRALAAVVGQSHHSSLAAATLARAADRLLRPPVKVTTGSPTLARAALRANPYTIIEHSTSSEAVVCIGTTCLQPTADSEQLREQITKI
ncbi:MAG: hypothetical protein ACREP9_02000, partial [Candidatus Dormibacteraceae bacterium]